MTICKAPEDRRSAPICVDGGQPLPIYLQGSCPAQCQSCISCGAELLTARHLICAYKRIFGCQNLHCHLVKPHVFAVSRSDFVSYLQPNQCCYPEFHLRKGTQKEHFCSNISLRKERSFKFSTRFSSSSFANANGAVCQKLFHKISHLPVSSTRSRWLAAAAVWPINKSPQSLARGKPVGFSRYTNAFQTKLITETKTTNQTTLRNGPRVDGFNTKLQHH